LDEENVLLLVRLFQKERGRGGVREKERMERKDKEIDILGCF
jgi:hypothetical protein